MEKFNCAYDELVDVDKLVPNPKNNNKHPKEQIERLAKIIDFQGQRKAIVVSNRSGFIVKGHGCLEAIKKLGWKQVAVDYQDYDSEAQEYADMTADNEIARWAEFDTQALLDELPNLDIDTDLLGLMEIPQIETEESEVVEDEVPEEVETRCKRGDVWKLGKHRLMCGDSTCITDVEKLMDGQKADMVFTDPPYGVKASGGRQQTKNKLGMKAIENDDLSGSELEKFLSDFISVMKYKSGASVYICYPWATQEEFTKAIKQNNLKIKNCIIWDKKVFGLNGFKGYRPQYEMIYFCCKEDFEWYGDKSQSNIWQISREIKREEQGNHPTPKPIELISKALVNSSKKQDCVYDAFGGSGSTLIACEQLNRKCFMMELDEHYCDVIIQRWENLTGKKSERIENENN